MGASNAGGVGKNRDSRPFYLSIYLSIYLSKKSRLGQHKCRDTTRAPNNVN